MVTLIVQKWQLKIIAPVTAVSVATAYAVHYTTGTITFTLISCIAQIFAIVIIIFCEDKIKWRMMWAIVQKEKWMQVNNFILNSIPENIVILGLDGQTKFISDYCKAFIQKCNLSPDPQDFFRKVHDLKQQQISEPHTPSISILQMTSANRFLGENIANLLVLGDLIENVKSKILRKELDERQFLIYNGKLKIENHQERSLEVKISFVQHFENYYIIVIIRDMTQRDLLISSEETNKYKDQLLASVSHELRAPLNGNINLVESDINIDIFCPEGVNDILDMSQIKEKKLRLVFNSENLKETLQSTAQLVELQAKKKGIELLVEIDPAVPKSLCTDHIRLSQIVLNLLNNAIKFTKRGFVRITATKLLPHPNRVQITVEDTGIGMSQDNVQKLFSCYTHIEFEERQNLNPTGVGLGLNIAYNLALLLGPRDHHQGITVTSIPDHGSTFTFIIENQQKVENLKTNNDSCEEMNESPQLRQTLRFSKMLKHPSNSTACSLGTSCVCPKIMIVDDNPFNTMAFETILSSIELKCDTVYSGSACIKNLLNRHSKVCGVQCQQYFVVFMDQEMPEMSGSETVKEIKRLQEENLLSQDIQVIGCTAHKSKEEIEKFMKAGINQCIYKPISSVLIKDILKETPLDI